MKKYLLLILSVFILPTLVYAANYSKTEVVTSSLPQTDIARPYVVDDINQRGEVTREIKGLSRETDPFLISKELGLNPYAEDRFSAFPDIKMNIGSKISLYRAPEITIKDGKKVKIVRSWEKTVGELLSEQSIDLGQEDQINFSLSTEIENEMKLVITRVAKTTVVVPEVISYKVTKKLNPNEEKSYKKVLQSGVNGKKNKYYLVTRVDGEEVSRVFTKSEIASDPIEEIVEVGTKIVVLDSGKATWYVKTSAMLAASNKIPKGTKVRIVNLNNGKSVVATISGGGIYHEDNVVVDLSTAAFEALGASLGTGKLGNIRVEKYYPTE